MTNQLYQQTVLKHYKNPQNFGELQASTHQAEGINRLCGDDVTIYLLLEGDFIKAIQFTGKGCAISQASASVMTEALTGLSVDQAMTIYGDFLQMTQGGDHAFEGDLAAFSGIKEFPSRIKCVTLAWKTFEAALEGKQETVSTE